MTRTEPQSGPLVLGSILAAVWLFVALEGDDPAWLVGGLLGAGLIGLSHAARQATPEVRTALNIAMGLGIGFGLIALVGSGFWFLIPLLSFLLMLGATASIVSGLPREVPEAHAD